jgi:hypothetical protein
MRHDRLPKVRPGSILTRKRFQFASALAIGALLPWALRWPLPGAVLEPASTNALAANVAAVIIAMWMRLSIETYPGIRRSYVILPSALTGHGLTLVWFLMTRLPYDRLALSAGFVLHVIWLYALSSTPSGACGGGSRWCRSARPKRLSRSTTSTG